MYKYGDELSYTIKAISPDDDKLLGDIACGNEIINDYINSNCKNDVECVT